MSEITRQAQQAQSDLLAIFDVLQAILPKASKTKLYAVIARRLTKTAGRKRAWTMRYIMSIITGSVPASAEIAHAIALLAADIDGTPPEFSEAEPLTLNADPAKVQTGALVLGASKMCEDPTCTVVFVPTVPWGKYCPKHRSK